MIARPVGDPVQDDSEPGLVGGQDLGVVGQGAFLAPVAGCLDQGPVAQGDPAGLGESGADEPVGEVGSGRGLVPPAGWLEVGQAAGAALDPVLGLVVPADVQVAVGGVGEPEGSAGVGLVGAGVEPQRVVAVPAEANVDQPRSRAVNIDAQGQVIERRPQPAGAEDASGQQVTRKPKAASTVAKAPLSS
jgi:hypothetical protein